MNTLEINSPSQILTKEHVPNIKLCRFFNKQAYVDSFINGEYRFGNLKQYRDAKLDARYDPTETESLNCSNDGSVYSSWSTGNYYALCFTELNNDTKTEYLASKFGVSEKPAIQLIIKDNIALTKSIINAWNKSIDRSRIAYFQWHKVVYNKNEICGSEPQDDNQDLHVYQKPKQLEIFQLKRIKLSPVSSQCIDLGGEIGSVKKFSSLNPLEMKEYTRLVRTHDWKKHGSNVNDFEIEQEWRLVFFSGDGFNKLTNNPFKSIEERYFALNNL